jgi:hypothetical protein
MRSRFAMDFFGNGIRPLSARAAWPIFTRFCLRRSIAWQDVRLAPGRLVTPDFAAHARGLLAPRGQPHKIYDGEPCALSKEPAAEDGLRAHDRHVIAAFRSAHCHC